MASSSLQFPDLAADQLDHAINTLGLRGAAVGGHVAGEDLSLPKLEQQRLRVLYREVDLRMAERRARSAR